MLKIEKFDSEKKESEAPKMSNYVSDYGVEEYYKKRLDILLKDLEHENQ